jgi:hypothetical protein
MIIAAGKGWYIYWRSPLAGPQWPHGRQRSVGGHEVFGIHPDSFRGSRLHRKTG